MPRTAGAFFYVPNNRWSPLTEITLIPVEFGLTLGYEEKSTETDASICAWGRDLQDIRQ